MSAVTTDDLEQLINFLRVSPELFSPEYKLQAAVKLFAAGRVSSGKAAELTGISRIEFLERLAEFDVPVIDLTAEELAQDVENAANWIADDDGLPNRSHRISSA